MEKLKGKELMEKFHRGFKNKHYKKAEIINLMCDVEIAYLRITQLKRKAGFFDKRGNIFEKDKCSCDCHKGGLQDDSVQSLCQTCCKWKEPTKR